LISIITFNEAARVIQSMIFVQDINTEKLDYSINNIREGGGTDLVKGMIAATKQFELEPDNEYRERRIIYLTDMCDTSSDENGPIRLFSMALQNAEKNIFTSYIGVGIDFNTNITEKIIKVKGSNYFCIFSEKQFSDMLVNEFNYNFFPCAFDVKLRVTSAHPDFIVDKVYGTPYTDEMITKDGYWSPSTHLLFPEYFKQVIKTFLLCSQRLNLPELPPEILSQIINYISPPKEFITQINTLFPSAKNLNETKGGLNLISLTRIGNTTDDPISVNVEIKYRRPSSKLEESSNQTIEIPTSSTKSIYSHEGMRKAVYLQRYVKAVKDIIENNYAETEKEKLRELSIEFKNEVVAHFPLDTNIKQIDNDIDSFLGVIKEGNNERPVENCITM